MYIAKTEHTEGLETIPLIGAVICDKDHLDKHGIIDYCANEPIYLCTALERKELSVNEMLCVPKHLITAYSRRVSADRSSQRSGASPISQRHDINVFVVDTGINKLPSLNVVGGFGDNCFVDENGHGTHVAGIIGGYDPLAGITGIVPGVRLWSVKTTNDSKLGMLHNILKGLDWIYQSRGTLWKGHGIVNVSLAGGINKYLDEAVDKLTKNGIIVCAAAGNFSGNANNYSPARCPGAITVGATYQPDYNSFAIYSNHGSAVDILAPGADIYSLFTNDKYAVMSGTSMACPIVTGTVAIMLSKSIISIREELLAASAKVQSKNADNTITINPRIRMCDRIRALGTTDVCVKVGYF